MMLKTPNRHTSRRIAVIGAGVIGLSTAVQLREALPQQDEITVFGKEFTPDTTGDSAGGFWFPVYYGNTPEENLRRWGKATWDYLTSKLSSANHNKMGIFYSQAVAVSTKTTSMERPAVADIVATFRMLTSEEAKKFHPEAKSGYMMTTLFSEGRRTVEYLLNRFVENGGQCTRREIFKLDELVDEGYDLIVNCTGLGAGALCSDPEVYPIRGQIHMIEAPWMRTALFVDDSTYILPNQDKVILGGTHQDHDWTRSVRESDRLRIFADCAKLDPTVMTARPLGDWVGLRPGRTTTRLEREDRRSSRGKAYTVVHNYGHGGSGLTLFWGCAEEAKALVLDALASPHARL